MFSIITEFFLILILSSPILVDNLFLTEAEVRYPIGAQNFPIEDDIDSVVHLVNNWIKSVAADEGHHEIGIAILFVFWLPSLINVLITVCPFINENNECDTLLLFSDVTFVGLGFLILILPVFGYYTITSSVTWTIPVVFNLFLPFIEMIGKFIRALNIALRLSSNLTAGHLLMLLISSFSEFLLSSTNWILKLIGFVTFNFSVVVTCLESCLICIQTYVWSILILYYLNQDE